MAPDAVDGFEGAEIRTGTRVEGFFCPVVDPWAASVFVHFSRRRYQK
jgi:hypothetical protein